MSDSSPEPVVEPAPDPRATSWADILVVILAVVVPALWSAITYQVWPDLTPVRPPIGYHQTTLITESAGQIGLVLLLVTRSGFPPGRFGLGRPRWLADVPTAVLLVPASYAYAVWVLSFLPGDLWDVAGSTASLYPPPPRKVWEFVVVVVGCLTTGFTEELVFRSYLLTRFEQTTNSRGLALVMSSVLFGAVHLYQGPPGVVNATAIGLLYGAIFLACRRVWGVALGHGCYDILLVAFPDF